MTHLDPELLSAQALSDASALDETARRHLDSCHRCRAEVEELSQLVTLGHSLTYDEALVIPPEGVWERITAELESDEEVGQSGKRFATPPEHDDQADKPLRQSDIMAEVVPLQAARQRRRGWGPVAVAAAVGLAVGALGAVGILGGGEDAPTVVAQTRLAPLPGTTGAGTVELREADGQLRLDVTAQGLPTAGGDLEIWLLNVDGERMQPLGLLTQNQDGSFTVPGGLLEDGYQIVDISLEPRDGNLAHSGQSELRGTLPA